MIFCPAGRSQLIIAAACLFGLFSTMQGCKLSTKNAGDSNSNGSGVKVDISSTPPYPTKEPDTYQAKYVTSIDFGGKQNALAAAISSMKKEIFVAKDGAQRRQDFEMVPGIKVSYLQNSQGQFVLLPTKKLYATLNTGALKSATGGDVAPGFSPDRLLNQQSNISRYERLGSEDLDGRPTVKYRITPADSGPQANGTTNETLTWVDESLGMPVKWEVTSKNPAGEQSTYTMVVEEIQQKVDPGLFQIPHDFTKVEYREIQGKMYGANPSKEANPTGKTQ